MCLINTNMPSILAEVGFISNPDEEKLSGKGFLPAVNRRGAVPGVKKYVDSRSPHMMGT